MVVVEVIVVVVVIVIVVVVVVGIAIVIVPAIVIVVIIIFVVAVHCVGEEKRSDTKTSKSRRTPGKPGIKVFARDSYIPINRCCMKSATAHASSGCRPHATIKAYYGEKEAKQIRLFSLEMAHHLRL